MAEVVVWFDEGSVVDGVVAVFGPLDSRLTAGQRVVAVTADDSDEGNRRFGAEVLHVTEMHDRDIAAVRLDGHSPDAPASEAGQTGGRGTDG